MTSQIARFSASLAVITFVATSGPVHGGQPDVVVSDAKIAGGRLVISGKAALAGMKLRLDGKTPAPFNAVSRFDKTFNLSVVYLPRDCIVSVQKVLPDGQLGASSDAVVANCAPSVIAPRGVWNTTASYEMTDVVAFKGASWLATEDNVNKMPGATASWQLFAAGVQSGQTGLADGTDASGTDSAGGAENGSSPETSARAIPTGAAGGDLAGTYPDPDIRDQAVTTAKLAPLAVAATNIKNSAITTAKIRDGAVNGVKIEDGAITSAKVLDDTQAGGGLTSADLAPDSVTESELATNSVNATEIADNSIDSGEIVDNSLFGTDIADGSIFSLDIANGSLTAVDIADGSLGTAEIASESLTLADLAGANISGSVNLSGVANGRCTQVTLGVSGAKVGDIAVVATNGAIQNGVFLYAMRVSSDGHVEASICNFSGAAMTPITNLPVRVVTFR